MLNGFQSDLSSISSEIQSLQDQSIAMNVKLKNRQVAFCAHIGQVDVCGVYVYIRLATTFPSSFCILEFIAFFNYGMFFF